MKPNYTAIQTSYNTCGSITLEDNNNVKQLFYKTYYQLVQKIIPIT